MNKIVLIGNLTKDPELSVTPSGVAVCTFTIAVNGRGQNAQNTAQFFRISAWRQLGENCKRYLAKGRKVFVSGPLTARMYDTADGQTRISLEVTAVDVEFLSSRNEDSGADAGSCSPLPVPQTSLPTHQMTMVETDELPF